MVNITSVMPKWRFTAANVDIPSTWNVRFIDPSCDEELIDACEDALCLLVPAGFQNVTANVLEHSRHLKLVQTAGAGFDGVDIKTADKFKIPVANIPSQNAQSVAEYTIGLIIALQRKIYVADSNVKSGNYVKIRKTLFQQGLTEINGSVVGLIGFGSIAKKVAVILKCLGASVIYYSHHRHITEEKDMGIAYRSLEDLLAESDVVSLHVPLTDKTKNMLGKNEFAHMKQTALLINSARGEIADQDALAEALENKVIAGAAIDVLYPEPPNKEHPLLNLSAEAQNKILLTPHIGGVTVNSFYLMLTKAIENIQSVIDGKQPKYIVNAQ